MVARHAVLHVAVLSGKETRNALGIHAERLLPSGGIRSLRAVGNVRDVVAVPQPLCLIPPDESLSGTYRLTVLVAGGTVVEHVDIVRPDPCKVRVDAHIAVVFLTAAPRHVHAVAIDARKDPHARHRRAVVADLADAAQEMSILQVVAVALLHDVLDIRLAVRLGIAVVPCEELDRVVLRVGRVLIELYDALPELVADPVVGARVVRGIGALHAPLDHAHGVRQRSAALEVGGRRHIDDLGLDVGGVVPRTLPECRRLVDKDILYDECIEVLESLVDNRKVRIRHLRILSADVDALDDALNRLLEHDVERIVVLAVADRQRVEHIIIRRICRIAVPCLEEVLQILRLGRTVALRPLREGIRLMRWIRKVCRQILEHDAVVRRGLHVRLSAHRVDAAARDTNVAHEQLDDRKAADVLHADRVLRHAERVHHHRRGNAREELRRLLDVRDGHARDRRGLLERIAREMLREAIHDRARLRHRQCLYRLTVCVDLVAPRRLVIRTRLLVVAREDARIEFVVVTQQAVGIRIAAQVVGIVFFVLNNIIDKCSEECDICAGPQLEEMIGNARGACIAHIDVDDGRSVVLCLHDAFHRERMAFCEVRPLDPDQLCLLEVVPRACHRAAPKGGVQSRRRRRMTDARLVVNEDYTESACHLDELVALLVVDLRAANKADGIRTVAHELVAVRLVLTDPVLVTRLLEGARGTVDGLLPADLLPMVAAGCAVERALRTQFRVRDVTIADALRTETAAIDGIVCRTFEVDQLAVLDVADRSAAAAAEVADGGKFATARQLVLFCRRRDRCDVQTETGECQPDAA